MFKFNTWLERPLFKLNGIKMGKNVKLIGWPCIFRFPGSEIEIGDDCLIRRRGASIRIGKNVGISGSTVYAWNGIEIGDNTLIGANCKILDSDLHPLDAEARNANNWDEVKTAPIVIGKNCFIGCNTLILKGVHLGDGCVIGAGSVVTKDIPPDCVAAGNPARVIRKLKEK